jgi:8-oxo-dGTP pyrophosphatase MutT (NUDIX family)
VVRRPGGNGGWEYLLLHRAYRGPDYAGDWAWTPPSGARLPGEPVLAGALRELKEEAGISCAEPVPVDLSGPWAIFLAEVPARTQVRLDAEHDGFGWVLEAEAMTRCRPASVAAGVAAAAAVPRHNVAFRQHGSGIDGIAPVQVHVVLVAGRPCGFIEHYPVGGLAPDGPTAAGLCFRTGIAGRSGKDLATQLIWAYLVQVVAPRWPRLKTVLASPDAADPRSIRALEKAGFRPAAANVPAARPAGPRPGPAGPGQPELSFALDRLHMLGPNG